MNNPRQRVFLLVFTRYTHTSFVNEQVVGEAGNGDADHEFRGPTEEDVFPTWADESHPVDCGSGHAVRSSNLQELNALLAKGWCIQSGIPMADGCSCLMILRWSDSGQVEARGRQSEKQEG